MSESFSEEVNLKIEYPFVKIVHDCLSKVFRSTKRYLEKEIMTKITALNSKNMNSIAKEEEGFYKLKSKMSEMQKNIEEIQQKYQELAEKEDTLLDNLQKRLLHLQHIEEHGKDLTVQNEYYEKRLWRLIIEYMLREGFIESGKALIEELNLSEFSDLDYFLETKHIVDLLEKRQCKEAIEWCSLNRSKLQSSLEFELRIQEFISILKENRYYEAVQYARENFEKVDAKNQITLQKVMGMLSFDEKGIQKIDRYREFLGDEKWQWIIKMFREESCAINSLSNDPALVKCLSIGTSILKTIFCGKEDFYNDSCPTCSASFKELCEISPSINKSTTSLICPITGVLMDENNPPMLVPNGSIYSEKSMKENAEENNGYIICPRTKKKYLFEKLKRVYIS